MAGNPDMESHHCKMPFGTPRDRNLLTRAEEEWENADDDLDDGRSRLMFAVACAMGMVWTIILALVVGVTWWFFGLTAALIAGGVTLGAITIFEWRFYLGR